MEEEKERKGVGYLGWKNVQFSSDQTSGDLLHPCSIITKPEKNCN